MNTKLISVLCIVTLCIILSYSASKAFAQTARFSVGFVMSPMQVGIGEDVTINVTITNMPSPGLFAYEFRILYNPTLLNATTAEIPASHFLTPVIATGNFIAVDQGTITPTNSSVSFAGSLLNPEAGKTGNGTLAKITFKALAAGNASLVISGLTIANPIFLDPTATPYSTSDYQLLSGSVQLVPEFIVPAFVAAFGVLSAATVLSHRRINRH